MMTSSARFALHPLARAAALFIAGSAVAGVGLAQQSAEPVKLERVEITGSSIKRIEGETALPVQVIKREEIDKSGVTTAAELLRNISANTAPLSDGASITDGTSGQRGFNGADLRGIGVSNTLVLLNGRRLANFATPGDNAGVDLNNIPAGAIQRVEILKDGASAIYGTDAIGGVINFITRKDYQGLDLGVYYGDTQHGGAGKKTVTLSGGIGDIAKDRFNVFGVLDYQNLGALRSSQRDWVADRPLATFLPSLMSSNTYPANLRVRSQTQWDSWVAAGLLPAGAPYVRSTLVNPGAPGCNPPATVYAPASRGGLYGCSYDYMEDTEIYPKSDRIGLLGRATWQITDNHQLYAELLLNRTESTYRLSPNPQRFSNFPVADLPAAWAAAVTDPTAQTINRVQWRMTEAGNRTNEVTSTAARLVAGATGTLFGWDYDGAYSRAQNSATDRYVDGYVLYDQLESAAFDGRINLFGPSTPAGRAFLDSIKINDEARRSRGWTDTIDFKATRPVMALAGGDMMVALGSEFRREVSTFTPSALLLSNNIAGDRDSSGGGAGTSTDLRATRDSRNVFAVFSELNAPVSKTLEAQLAVRYDHYGGVGSTVNPKAGLRWTPDKALLVRASAGTGFRAPSLYDLHGPTTYGSASSFSTDPVCVSSGLDTIDNCTDQWPVQRVSNPNLKPEKSRQESLGLVFQPMPELSMSIDFWAIQKRDVISTLGEQEIVSNAAKYDGTLITRDEDGYISNILLQKENQGKLQTSGFDLGAEYRTPVTPWGRFGVALNGTLVLKYERQFGAGQDYQSNLGRFLNDQVIQRWRHRIAFDWDRGPFGVTLANTFLSSYEDQNLAYDQTTNMLLPARRVGSYSLWDLSAGWKVSPNLRVRAGVNNLFDRDPPFSNQNYYFLAGYDPTYTDPRGRFFYASIAYSFR
jgi:iron complex outermembrane receptor protein